MATFPVKGMSRVVHFLIFYFTCFLDHRRFAWTAAALWRVFTHATVASPVAARLDGALAGASSVGLAHLRLLSSPITTVTSHMINLHNALPQTLFVRHV